MCFVEDYIFFKIISQSLYTLIRAPLVDFKVAQTSLIKVFSRATLTVMTAPVYRSPETFLHKAQFAASWGGLHSALTSPS